MMIDERDDRWNKRPAEQKVEQALPYTAQVELVGTDTSRKKRQQHGSDPALFARGMLLANATLRANLRACIDTLTARETKESSATCFRSKLVDANSPHTYAAF